MTAMSRANNNHRYRQPSAASRADASAPHYSKLEITRLDAQVAHLSNVALPKAPYLISVPSDVPYRHNSRFVNNWHLGTPFAKEEEPLQYMSFLTHQDEEQSLIKAVGGWSDKKGNFIDEDPSPQQIYGNTTNSPYLGGQRKKISLNDYKSKAKGGEDSNRSGNMGQPAQQRSNSKNSHTNGMSRVEVKDQETKTEPPIKEMQERKRSFDDAADSLSQVRSPKPEKRARTRSPVRPKSPRRLANNVDKTKMNINRVPSLLSPTLPPSDNVTSIPKLLSPTLPFSIEDLLADSGGEQESHSIKNHKRSDSARSVLGPAGLGSSPLSASKKIVIARTEHERHLSPSLQLDLKEARISPGARGRASTSSPGPRQRHVIVLKYGKRNKKRVEGLLKFAPRSKKQVPRTEVPNEPKHGSMRSVNGTLTPSHESAPKRDKEGPTSHPSEPPPKRSKIAPSPSSLNLSERPTTPIPPAFKSPSTQNPLQPRSAFSTPKKDLKTTAMRRFESSDGLDARTPIASMIRQSTPGSTEKPLAFNRLSSPSDQTSASSNRDDLRRAWKALGVKYFDLGRTLKHEAQSLLQDEPTNGKHGVLLHIEALLCFMLNQTALAHANNGSDLGWRTVLPYLGLVLHVSKPFPHLQGLVAQMGAVCRQTIAKYDLERLAREPLPDDHSAASAPTPGSDGNTKNSGSEDSDKARRRWVTFRTELTDNAKELQRAWLDGYQKLSPEILKQEFPETWARRSRDSSLKAAAGPEKLLTPDNLGGKYFLPLDANSTPVEAVRYAKGVLGEWAGKEGNVGKNGETGWKARIAI